MNNNVINIKEELEKIDIKKQKAYDEINNFFDKMMNKKIDEKKEVLRCELCDNIEDSNSIIRKCPFGILVCDKCEHFTDKCDYIAFNQSCSGKCGRKTKKEDIVTENFKNVQFDCPKCGNGLFTVSLSITIKDDQEKQDSITMCCNNDKCTWHKIIPVDFMMKLF